MSEMRRWLLAVALAGVLSLNAFGQVASAELSGTVLDSSGAVVANAKVTAEGNLATNLARDAASDTTGKYIITLLPPGDYTVSVEAPVSANWSKAALLCKSTSRRRST